MSLPQDADMDDLSDVLDEEFGAAETQGETLNGETYDLQESSYYWHGSQHLAALVNDEALNAYLSAKQADGEWLDYIFATAYPVTITMNREEQVLNLDAKYAVELEYINNMEVTGAQEDSIQSQDSNTLENSLIGYLYDLALDYSDSTGNQGTYVYQVPLVLDNSADARTINASIQDNFGADVEEELENMTIGCSVSVIGIHYQVFYRNNILTLVIQKDMDYDYTYYAVYHYNTELHCVSTNEQILTAMDISLEGYLDALRAAAEQEFLKDVSEQDLEILGGEAFFDEQCSFTMSNDNLNMDTMMYVDEEGTVWAIVPIASFAGASWYYHVISVLPSGG